MQPLRGWEIMLRIILMAILFAAFDAQAEETLIPVDTAGWVMNISVELEQELRLFPEYPEFREARLYRRDDSTYALEISYKRQSLDLRDRKSLSAAEVLDLQQRVSRTLYANAPEISMDQSGRNKLVIGNTVAGVFYYDWLIPVAVGAHDEEWGSLYWVTGGLNYLIPFLATQHAEVTRSTATMWLYGATRGPWHGAAFWALTSDEVDDADERTGAAWATVAGYGEAAGLYAWAKHSKMSDGRAATIGVGGDFGAGVGIAAALLMSKDHNEGESDEARGDRVAGLGLAGSVGGLMAYNKLAVKCDYTRGDAYVTRATGYLGAGVPMLLLAASGEEDEDVYAAAGIAGAAAGLGLGHLLTLKHHASRADGQMALAGMIAGGMFGFGIGLAGHHEETEFAKVSTALGALGGFALSYYSGVGRHALAGFEPEFMAGVMPNRGQLVPSLTMTCARQPRFKG